MGNFKIKVNSEAESKEAQELFFKLGYKDRKNWTQRNPIHESIQAWADGEFTFSLNHNRVPVGFKEITLPELRAMVNPMKEYLNKKPDGSYELIVSNGGCVDGDWIEVPNGMNYAYGAGSFIQFTKQEMGYRDSVLVWQRESEAESLVDWSNVINNAQQIFDHENAGKPPLNDQYAEIEQVRQHQHYFIDVSDVDEIDFYEIALRYNVTDPCIQHILKKCLAVGQRGQKDFHHDLKDIHDTSKRMLAVHGLDS